jgi:4-amino-4-deoxy-L-arabinose transferase-like glycosyltransferase
MHTPQALGAPGAVPDTERRVFCSPRLVFALLAVYFIGQVIIRTLTSPSIDLDESEQVLFAQRLSWGYGPDPPLYTWLQMGLFAVFGTGVFALALLKNLLLFGTYVFTYRNARFITGSELCGAAAALSLLFIPTIAWESQRDLTHSVLATTMATASLGCFLRLQGRPGTAWYVLFGLAVGAGLLAKFNFALWLLGLLCAALLEPRLRKAVWDWRMGLALALCVLMVTPYGLWVVENHDRAFGNVSKLAVGQASWAKTVLVGLGNLVVAVGSVLGPMLLIYLAVFARSRPREPLPDRTALYVKLILRAILFIFATSLLLILVFRATGFRERWFQSLLVAAPVAVVAWLSNRFEPRRAKWLMSISVMVMAVIICVIPGRIVFGEKLKREEPLMRPYAEVGGQIRSAVPESAVVVADTVLLAGNLRLALPGHEVLGPRSGAPRQPDTRPLVFVWDARKTTEMPAVLRKWADTARPGGVEKGAARYLSGTYYHHTSKRLRIGLLLVE